MDITINGTTIPLDPSILSSLVFPIFSIVIFFIIFGVVGLIIRSGFKNIAKQLPTGASLKEINKIVKQFPKGVSWTQLKNEWDIKMDRETGRITVKRKTSVGKEGDSTIKPTEIQVTQLAQLPGILRKLVKQADQSKPGNEGVQFTPARTPSSASSKINTPQTVSPKQMGGSPRSYELGQTIKRVLLILLLIGLYYGVKSFFA